MDMQNAIEPAAIISVIIVLVQCFKQIPIIADNKKWCPTLSVCFGLILGVIASIFLSGENQLSQTIFYGLIYGLSACGLYSFGNQFLRK